MTTALLSCAGRPVGRYGYGPGADSRPYLHPVTTLAGTPVTEERPADPNRLLLGETQLEDL